MPLYTIDIGAVANDGTGDPLRTAFNEVNLNFEQVFTAGPVLSNIQIANNTILTTNTNGNLVLAPNGVGVVQANVNIVPNTSNIRNLGAADRRWSTLYIQYANVSGSLTVADLTATGNVTVGGNLSVTGNIINVANIITDAKTIQLANTAGTANAASGSGITVGANDAIATMLYSSATNAWTFNIGIDTPNIVVNNISSDDSTFVTIQDGLDVQGDITAETLSLTGTVTAGNILPRANVTYSIGNSTLWWSNIWVAGNTMYIGGVPLGMAAGNVLTVDGNSVVTTDGSGTSNIANLYISGTAITLAAGASETAISISPNGESQSYIEIPDNATANTANARLHNDAGNVEIGTGGGSYLWFFDNQGDFTAPGNITANFFLGNGSQLTGLATSSISNGTSNVDIPVANGNVTINTNGTYAWTFDDAGNLTLPTNGSIVVDGGDGVIGPVSDDFVISWDNEEIRLVSVQGSIEMQADSAFRVQTNYDGANVLYASRWEFSNNELVNISNNFGIVSEAGNLTLSGGRDGVNSGNSIIRSVDVGVAVYDWTFDNAGVLTLPNGGEIDNDGNNIELRSGNNINFEATSDLNIYTDDGNSQWTFGSGNTLTLPGGTAVIDSSDNNIELRSDNNISMEANNVVNVYTVDGDYEFQFGDDGGFYLPNNGALVGVTANNNGYINWVGNSSGDGNGFTTMQLVPDGTVETQSLVLDPTAPGHIHLRAPGLAGNIEQPNANIFLGPENTNFEITSQYGNATAEARIHSAGNTWTFANDGNLVLPSDANIVGTTPNNAGHLQWLGNSAGDGSGSTTLRLIPDDTLEGNEQYIIIDPTGGGDIHIRPGGNIDNSNGRLILGGENSAFVVESGPNPTLKIFSDENEWAFYGNAELAAPGDISAVGNITGSYIIGDGSQLTGLPAQYGDANVASFLAAYGSNNISTTGNITAGNFIGSGSNVDLIAGAYTWQFDNTGNLVLPANTFAVNYANGTAVSLGGNYGDSNVVSLLGTFGSNNISTTGNVTAGNLIGNIQLTGNIQGTSANVELVAGSYTFTFDNTGVATFPTIGGDEGGEINLGIPAANTTLQNSVKIDVYQDRLRFFEGSANVKGAYLDLANCPSGVSTAIGYREIPQIAFSANATAAANAAGCHYYSTTAGNLALTLPDNSSVAFPTGATLTVVVNAAGNVLVNQGTGVSLYQAGASATGNRVVGAYGLATVMKVAANTWVISGTGVY